MPYYFLALFFIYKLQARILFYLKTNTLNLSFYILYCIQGLLFILLLALRPACIQRDEMIEAYIKKYREDIEPIDCKKCNLTRPMRTIHCFYCEKCVAKWQTHSHWFNVCIGSRNLFIYSLYNLFAFTINILSIVTCFYYNSIRINRMPKVLLYVVFLFIQCFMLAKEVIKYTLLVVQNQTRLERDHWRRVSFMLKNEKYEYFNPFDRGIINNVRQAIRSIFNFSKIENTSLHSGILVNNL